MSGLHTVAVPTTPVEEAECVSQFVLFSVGDQGLNFMHGARANVQNRRLHAKAGQVQGRLLRAVHRHVCEGPMREGLRGGEDESDMETWIT